MVTRQRVLIAAAVGAAALAVGLVLALRGGGGGVASPAAPVSAVTHFSRSGTLFADPLRANVQVIVDRTRVDPDLVGFTADFRPFVRVHAPQVTRHDMSRLTRLVYSVDLICLTNTCLSKDKPEAITVQFPPVRVFFTAETGGRKVLRLPWTPMTIGPRTGEADIKNADPFLQPSWRASTDPLAVSYDTSPRTLRTVLFVVSGLLLAFALFALARFVVTGKLRFRILSPLERALVLVERTPAETPERRKALELLSHELSRTGEAELAVTAKELAWAEPTPLPTLTQPLTLDVRRVIEQRSNGHA
ncbi:MAG: hypothetical protein ACJ74D_10750 [Gaiellaceae bacterium]